MRNIIFSTLLLMVISSCTENERARNYGGKETINLPKGKKLEQLTWKDHDLWIQTRDFTPLDTPQTHTFYEKSTWGMFEGEITVIETK